MNESEHKQANQTLVILGLIALIVALFIGIKLIFAGLAVAIPQEPAAQEQVVEPPLEEEQTVQAPQYCPFCGKELHDAFQWGQYCPFCGEHVLFEDGETKEKQ